MIGSQTKKPMIWDLSDRDFQSNSATTPNNFDVNVADFEQGKPIKSGWLPFFTSEMEINILLNFINILLEGNYFKNSTISSMKTGWLLSANLAKNSTIKVKETPATLIPVFLHMFSIARDEEFEDGMETQFSKDLKQVIRTTGQAAVNALSELIPTGRVNIEVCSEALRWIGRMDDPATYESRRWLLERCLSSNFPRIRDGALLGLSAMNDPDAIQYLHFAIQHEEINELKEDFEQVLRDLEEQ